jgi:catalase
MATSGTPESVIRDIVDAMRALAGKQPGFRPVHAKGLVCAGTFRASADAARISRAPHFTGRPIPVVVRFANSSGNPDVHDGVPNVRSMAVKFQLADGKSADILANSIEGFIARTPAELLEFLRAQLPEPATGRPNPDAVPRFLASHPGGRAFVERLMKKPVPASYGQTIYHAEHAFRFTPADGSGRFGRYRFVPEAGEASSPPTKPASAVRPFYVRSWKADCGPDRSRRVQAGLAAGGDRRSDVRCHRPVALGRPLVELGRLEVTSISPTSAADERRLIFDPTNTTDGIELSDDPILPARSAAYSISYDRRRRGE